MTETLMLKAFFRAGLASFLIIIFIAVLWHHPLLTLGFLAIAWFGLMLQLDPPEEWDR